MKKAGYKIYSRSSREWIPISKHRAGWFTSPNSIHMGDGYMTGTNGFPVPMLKWVDANGNEKGRFKGTMTPTAAYAENDEIHVRVKDLAQLSVFYVRYNQIKEFLIDLGDLVNTRTIGLRNNNPAGLGHVNLQNLHLLENLDLSGAWSVTDITVSPQAPINFYYLRNTSIGEATKDYLIQMAVDSGVLNGTLDYDGRPSYDAWPNYDILVDRGWTMALSPLAGTTEILGTVAAGTPDPSHLQASHRLTWHLNDATGVVETGWWGNTHTGMFSTTPFTSDMFITVEYYQPTILSITADGKLFTSLNLTHMTSMITANFPNNLIPTVNVDNMVNLANLDLSGNPLTSLSVAGTAMTNLNVLDTDLDASDIDGLLAQLVANGELNGNFQYDVQPTSAAYDNYNILISRGWNLSIAPNIPIPDAPTNVVFSNVAENSLTVSWDAKTYADAYVVYRRLAGAGTWTNISGDITATTYNDSGLSDGTDYEYQIGAKNATGEAKTAAHPVSTVSSLPATPTGLQVTVSGDTTFLISWNAVANATDYYYQIEKVSDGSIFQQAANADTDVQVNFLYETEEYIVRVKARNASGDSAYASVNATAGGQVPAVTISGIADGEEIMEGLTYSIDVVDASGGNVEFVKLYNNGVLLHQNLISAFPYEWTAPAAGTYSLTTVAGSYTGLEGPESSPVNGNIVASAKPAAPANVTVIDQGYDYIDITWDIPPHTTSQRIYWSIFEYGFLFHSIGMVNTFRIDRSIYYYGAPAGEKISILVRAYNAFGNTYSSSVPSFTLPDPNGCTLKLRMAQSSGTTVDDGAAGNNDGVMSMITAGDISWNTVDYWWKYLEFNSAIDKIVTIPAGDNMNPSAGTYSISIMVKDLFVGSGTKTIMELALFKLRLVSGELEFRVNGSTSYEMNVDDGLFVPDANGWLHIGFTYDGTYGRVYTGGTLLATQNLGSVALINMWSKDSYIGAGFFSSSPYQEFSGGMRDFRLVDGVLSAADMAGLAASI